MSDPNFSKVVLQLHCEGANGATTFTDSSSYGRSVTVLGTAQLSTSSPIIGVSSGLFDGSTAYLSCASSADFDFGSGDFTIQLRYKPTALTTATLITRRLDSTVRGAFYLGTLSSGAVRFLASTDGVNWTTNVSSAAVLSVGVAAEIVVSRVGGNLYVLVNGAVVISTTITGTLYNPGSDLFIGGDSNSLRIGGRIDEVRLIKGLGRYAAAYTVTSAAFSDSAVDGVAVEAVPSLAAVSEPAPSAYYAVTVESAPSASSARDPSARRQPVEVSVEVAPGLSDGLAPVAGGHFQATTEVAVGMSGAGGPRVSATFDTPLILTVDRSGSDVDYPLRLRVSTPEDVAYPLRLTVIDGATQGGLNGAGGWFAAPDGRWQGRVTVGGVDYSAMLVGTVTVRRAADESATAEFGFRHGGPIAPMGLVRQAVEIFFAGRGAAGEVINPQLLFRGVIDQPQVDVPRRMVQCLCSDRLQEAIDNTPREWIDSQIGGRYSAELSGAPDGNWRYAQERLASVPKSLALDVTGAPVVLPWRDVTRPLRVTEADQIDGSPTVTLPQASQVRTRIAVTAEYRYQVARNRGISSIWKREARWFINGPNGTDGPLDWLTTDMVEGALSSMEGWDLVSLEIEHPQPGDYSTGITIDAGVYTIKPEIAPSLAIGWIAHLFTAWQQTRTERYTLTVVDSALEAALGAPVSEEMGVTVTAPNMPPAWAADKTVTPRFAPAGLTSDIDAIQAALSGDTIYRHEPEIDGETPWQTFQAAALTLLDRARVRLWSAARSGRVRFSVPCRPDFFLWHRAEVETAQVHVEGDVVALTHTLDPERGTAVTEVDLAVGFPGNTAGGFAPLVLPDRPNPDAIPATSGPAGHFGGAATRQNWWVGGLPTSPQFNERQMLGYVTNSAKNALAPDADKAAMAWYPKQLTVEAPEVPAADRDPMEIPVAVEYPWSVPTDLLEVL